MASGKKCFDEVMRQCNLILEETHFAVVTLKMNPQAYWTLRNEGFIDDKGKFNGINVDLINEGYNLPPLPVVHYVNAEGLIVERDYVW